MLFGDSHAAQYFPALDLIARLRGWRLVVLTKAVCPPFEISIFSPILGRTYRECDEWRAAAFDRIAQEHPTIVVMGVARHYDAEYHFTMYGPEWMHAMTSSIERLRTTGAAVVVMGPTPKPPFDVPSCLAAHLADPAGCLLPHGVSVDLAGLANERSAAEAAGATYDDITRYLCTPSTCAVIVGNLLVYRDDNHMTTSFTKWLAPALAADFDAARAKVSPRTGGTG